MSHRVGAHSAHPFPARTRAQGPWGQGAGERPGGSWAGAAGAGQRPVFTTTTSAPAHRRGPRAPSGPATGHTAGEGQPGGPRAAGPPPPARGAAAPRPGRECAGARGAAPRRQGACAGAAGRGRLRSPPGASPRSGVSFPPGVLFINTRRGRRRRVTLQVVGSEVRRPRVRRWEDRFRPLAGRWLRGVADSAALPRAGLPGAPRGAHVVRPGRRPPLPHGAGVTPSAPWRRPARHAAPRACARRVRPVFRAGAGRGVHVTAACPRVRGPRGGRGAPEASGAGGRGWGAQEARAARGCAARGGAARGPGGGGAPVPRGRGAGRSAPRRARGLETCRGPPPSLLLPPTPWV